MLCFNSLDQTQEEFSLCTHGCLGPYFARGCFSDGCFLFSLGIPLLTLQPSTPACCPLGAAFLPSVPGMHQKAAACSIT